MGRLAGKGARAVAGLTRGCAGLPDVALVDLGVEWERAHTARLKRDCWAGGWAARAVRGSWLGQRAGPKREKKKGLIGPGFLFSFLFSISISNKV